jgi:hypothetical protein
MIERRDRFVCFKILERNEGSAVAYNMSAARQSSDCRSWDLLFTNAKISEMAGFGGRALPWPEYRIGVSEARDLAFHPTFDRLRLID